MFTKTARAKIAAVMAAMICVSGVITGCGSGNENSTVMETPIPGQERTIPEYTSDNEGLKTVMASIDTLRSAEYYADLGDEDRQAIIEEELRYYAQVGFVQNDTIYYDENTQVFTFAMRDGLTGTAPTENLSRME